ncbi:hypothetical protein F4776DRAFT_362969 [Hypoxylon sp. NC0597]|nr:hypothetical protein F4776DRAFT_362969 [Hypoxylon sp. NC0597]
MIRKYSRATIAVKARCMLPSEMPLDIPDSDVSSKSEHGLSPLPFFTKGNDNDFCRRLTPSCLILLEGGTREVCQDRQYSTGHELFLDHLEETECPEQIVGPILFSPISRSPLAAPVYSTMIRTGNNRKRSRGQNPWSCSWTPERRNPCYMNDWMLSNFPVPPTSTLSSNVSLGSESGIPYNGELIIVGRRVTQGPSRFLARRRDCSCFCLSLWRSPHLPKSPVDTNIYRWYLGRLSLECTQELTMNSSP